VIVLVAIVAAELLVIALLMVAFLLGENRQSNADYIALIDRLCQRLQAPAAAVLEHDEMTRGRRGEEYAPPAVEPDDDEAFWQSRDKLAEYVMSRELDERNG
jgi:adenine-specific DNA methylase